MARTTLPSTSAPTRRWPAAALALLVSVLVALAGVGVAAPASASTADVADRIFALVNAERAKRSLPQLQRITELDKVAQPWSNHQAATRTMAHNPSYSSQYPAGWTRASENVAYASSSIATGDRFMEMWMGSEGHRNNILNPYITHAGIGVAATSSGDRLYATQNFAQYPSSITFASTAPTTPVVRWAGADRYDTSAAISRSTFKAGVSVAYVANGLTSVDALSVASVAGMHKAPVLLTSPTALPNEIKTELARLKPGRIVILGSPGAVNGQVEAQLRSYSPRVERWAGADRYDTSASVSRGAFAPGVAVAYIANGLTYADALSAAPVAGMKGAPVLLTQPTALPSAISQELARLRPEKIVVLGSSGAVSTAVEARLRSFAPRVERLTGADRYATSAGISRATLSPGVAVAYVANGLSTVDALSAAPVAGMTRGPVLLTAANGLPASIEAELERLNPGRIVVLGGPGAVSSSVAGQLARIG